MKITARGESLKMDTEARALTIEALECAANTWLNFAADDKDAGKRASLLDRAGEAKALAKLLEPKSEDE